MILFRCLAFLVLLLCCRAEAQTATAVILPNGFTQFLDANGKPLANGKVYFYVPSTTTGKVTWQDPYQSITNPDPLTLNGSGAALIWGSGIYREVVYDVNNNLIWDQLTGGYNCTGGSGSGGSPAGSNGALQYNNSGAFGGLGLGTTTTVLHGNASGTPSWGAVNLSTDVTGTLPGSDITYATVGNVQAGTSTTTALNPSVYQGSWAPQTVAYGSTTVVNWATGQNAAVTMTGSITTLTLQNPVVGARYELLLTQGGSGSNTVTWPASVSWGAAGAPTLSTAVGKVDMIDLFVLNTSGPKYLAVAHLGF